MKVKPTYDELCSMFLNLQATLRDCEAALQDRDAALKEKDEVIAGKDEVIASKDEVIAGKDGLIAKLQRMLFGRKSERICSKPEIEGQLTLFDDQFKEAYDLKQAGIEQMAKEVEAESQKRRARAKKASRAGKGKAKCRYGNLEERTREVLPAGVDPSLFDRIGQDVTRILHHEPAKLWVEVVVRPILRLKADKNSPWPRIEQAPAPAAVIGGNHVGADVLADLVVNKYVHHLPEHRQARRYADLGVELPLSTMNGWVHATAARLYPLYETLAEDIRSRSYLQVDEVPWNIADRPGKCRKGYAWQFFDATPDSHGLYFYYYKGSRAGEIPRAQLKNYQGAIQTDGYKVYDYFERQTGVILLACMAHVRRKFVDAQSSHPEHAAKALGYIRLLYEIEANLKDSGATPEQVASERNDRSLKIMDAMKAWMDCVSGETTPSDPLGKAIEYAVKMWPRLRRYAEDGTYQIDNNPVERNQRPSVMGRKNYLFCKSDRGAEDNAVFYSLLESCQTVGVNQLQWLTDTLQRLADAPDPDDEQLLTSLLPHNYKKSQA